MAKKIVLRTWQKEAIIEWKKSNKGIVKVVTAAGKTIFAIECIKHALKENKINILVLVPTITLVEQWKIELKEILNIEFKINNGSNKVFTQSKFMISTNASIKNFHASIDHKNTFLISDECHRIGTQKMCEMLQGSWKYTLGLSILIPLIKNL